MKKMIIVAVFLIGSFAMVQAGHSGEISPLSSPESPGSPDSLVFGGNTKYDTLPSLALVVQLVLHPVQLPAARKPFSHFSSGKPPVYGGKVRPMPNVRDCSFNLDGTGELGQQEPTKSVDKRVVTKKLIVKPMKAQSVLLELDDED